MFRLIKDNEVIKVLRIHLDKENPELDIANDVLRDWMAFGELDFLIDRSTNILRYIKTVEFKEDDKTASVNLKTRKVKFGIKFFLENIKTPQDILFIILHEREHLFLDALYLHEAFDEISHDLINIAEDAWINPVICRICDSDFPDRFYELDQISILENISNPDKLYRLETILTSNTSAFETYTKSLIKKYIQEFYDKEKVNIKKVENFIALHKKIYDINESYNITWEDYFLHFLEFSKLLPKTAKVEEMVCREKSVNSKASSQKSQRLCRERPSKPVKITKSFEHIGKWPVGIEGLSPSLQRLLADTTSNNKTTNKLIKESIAPLINHGLLIEISKSIISQSFIGEDYLQNDIYPKNPVRKDLLSIAAGNVPIYYTNKLKKVQKKAEIVCYFDTSPSMEKVLHYVQPFIGLLREYSMKLFNFSGKVYNLQADDCDYIYTNSTNLDEVALHIIDNKHIIAIILTDEMGKISKENLKELRINHKIFVIRFDFKKNCLEYGEKKVLNLLESGFSSIAKRTVDITC